MAMPPQCDTGNEAVDKAFAQWMEWDKNPATRQQLRDLAERKDEKELANLLLQRMEFGTAGLRAAMAAGNARMNDLTVIQAAQGLCTVLEQTMADARDKGVVLGYDHRRNAYGCSEVFAKLSAAVFLSHGFKVCMFGRVTCTPFVPFAVRHFGAAAGVMVTASHNPKNDNGYKVYWSTGAQIVPPIDRTIAVAIGDNLQPWFDVWAAIDGMDDKVSNIFDACQAVYFAACRKASMALFQPPPTAVPIVYSAMHGVGTQFVARMFQEYSLQPVVPVPEQADPDPAFPTVPFPNPEEGKSALDRAMQLADSIGARHILANDPDADRLAVAEKLSNGEWRVLKGNEIGSLLAWWRWHCHTAMPQPSQPCAMIASTVSSKFIKAMAEVEGFRFEETLTGFKWMGTKALDLMADGYHVLLAYEEAIGFMVDTVVLDKDGVHAAAVVAQMVNYLEGQGTSLCSQLDTLYAKYGCFMTRDGCFLCHDPNILAAIFDAIRPNYPTAIGSYAVRTVRDMTVGYDGTYEDRKARLPITPEAQMVTFYFESGAIVTVRGSGTEPKLKYYSEMHGAAATPEAKAALVAHLDSVVAAVIDHFLHPTRHGLLPWPP